MASVALIASFHASAATSPSEAEAGDHGLDESAGVHGWVSCWCSAEGKLQSPLLNHHHDRSVDLCLVELGGASLPMHESMGHR